MSYHEQDVIREGLEASYESETESAEEEHYGSEALAPTARQHGEEEPRGEVQGDESDSDSIGLTQFLESLRIGSASEVNDHGAWFAFTPGHTGSHGPSPRSEAVCSYWWQENRVHRAQWDQCWRNNRATRPATCRLRLLAPLRSITAVP